MTRVVVAVLAALALLACVAAVTVALISRDLVGDPCDRPHVVLPEECPLDGA